MNDKTHALFTISKLMVVTFFLAHWMASLFYMVANNQKDTSPTSWIIVSGFQDESIGVKYTQALYWTITTMATVGYGDINPQTTKERLVAIVIMLMAAAIYAYIINEVGSIIKRINMQA